MTAHKAAWRIREAARKYGSKIHAVPGIDPPGQAHSDRNGPIQDPRLRSTGGMHASGRAAAGGSGGDR